MARELAYVLINPYTIAKSRTGGVIARYMNRTGLDLVAMRMFGPSAELVERYSALLRARSNPDSRSPELIADYVAAAYAPGESGKPQRVLMLLFEGDNAVERIWKATGSATLRWGSGETIRDTYGDYVLNADGSVRYFEPAVLVGPTLERTKDSLRLWSEYAESDGGVIVGADDVPADANVQTTLVMLKPDNFRVPSSRTGNIIDILSLSGLRIVGANKFSMSVAQAERFYGPVGDMLKEKMKETSAERAGDVLGKEFGLEIPEDLAKSIGDKLGPIVGQREFESIVQFMTGYRPSECNDADKAQLSAEECLALVYRGVDAVSKIRNLLGATDPAKAPPGSVRREYGSNIMVNAAHASDSPESAVREMKIINVEQDTVLEWVNRYYGDIGPRVKSIGGVVSRTGFKLLRNATRRWKRKETSATE